VASVEIADQLAREISSAAHRAGERPLSGRMREEIGRDLRSMRVHPYSIFYRATPSGIEIIRVLHERRNIKTLMSEGDRDRD